MQTMLQVWQKSPYIPPKGEGKKACHTIATQGHFCCNVFIARKNKNARSPNDYAGELKSW
jgi:hypothetical protein